MSARTYLSKSTVCASLLLALCLGSAGTASAQQKIPVDTIIRNTPQGAAKPPQERRLVQMVYKVNPWVTLPLNAVMTVGNFLAIPNILHAKKDISTAEIEALRPELLSPLDRWAVEQDPTVREKWFKVSDIALPATIALSLGIFADKNIRKDGLKIAAMFYEAQAVTFTIYNFSPLGPSFQNRFRPITYYSYFDPSERLRGGNRNSMFSGHSANAAAATFFAVKVYTDYHPEIGNKKYLLYAVAAVPAVFAGYTRVKALAHFPSDVFLGLMVGAISGISIPSLHKVRTKTVQFGVTYNEMGSGIGFTWKPAKKKFKPRNTFGDDRGDTGLLASAR
ncbi:phosphatase PAP2 family protein [Flaviaesturariibacter flavus]|uniref:Phosphatase PAP2 family protein n=1 Tax=Flaviaesturariibacter flavus TaxID=2502780 RepID=A0A4R1B7D0_9BACT|nr:phosphatase PAP2 family protein [Flaviaesturariibacter flavus]TCJ12418.1 phosphatase PAP2 family protein [Flaviaesturariibacter flavus]